MKNKVLKILALLTLSVACIVGVGISQTVAKEDKTLKIYACNLSFNDNVYILYAVDSVNISDKQNIKLLTWTEPQKEYKYGTQSYVLDYIGEQNVGGVACAVFQNDRLSAKQMTDSVYAVAYYDDGISGVYSEPVKYSILQYSYNKIKSSTDELLKQALKDMLQYGSSMQKYFNYRTERLANFKYYQVNVVGGVLNDGFSSGLFLKDQEIEINFASDGFACWNDGSNIVSLQKNFTYTVKSDVTLQNKVLDETFTVTFDGNDGTLVSGEETQTFNGATCVTFPVYERQNFELAGWETFVNSASKIITVKAKWRPLQYVVKFNLTCYGLDGEEVKSTLNGKTSVEDAYVNYGDTFDFSNYQFVPVNQKDYSRRGWAYILRDGTKKYVDNDTVFTEAFFNECEENEIILVAQTKSHWTPIIPI